MHGDCEGWAAGTCFGIADVTLVEQWPSGRWSSHELCVGHLKEAIDWWLFQSDPARTWILQQLGQENVSTGESPSGHTS